ncbi:MAG: Do family serine endopeptidase [Prevotella sp.]|jgi:Do/DeqQ family serine protease|nr:Do family serine endopeptidase [Prevotella sp.]
MKISSKNVIAGFCLIAITFGSSAFVQVNAAPLSMTSEQPVDLTYAAAKAVPAVVHIKFVKNSTTQTVDVQGNPFDFFDDPFGFFGNPNGGDNNGEKHKEHVRTPKQEATGSGVIISPDGYIVTNNHVVNGADELTVTLNDNREFSARIIGTDPVTDLALIKINAKNLPTLPIGDSDKLKIGEWVLAVGNPYNLSSTVTAGIVSAKARSLGGDGEGPQISSFIQTDAAINPGNSGGALVNTKGELVGINAMLYSQTGSFTGYGFAIPTNIMVKVIDDLKKYGSVQRAWLGIKGSDVINYINVQKDQGKDVNLGTNQGVYVDEVEDNSAGAAAGLQKGDVIISINGQKITKISELQQVINAKKPGDKIKITYLHNKRPITKEVTLKNTQGTTNVIKPADLDVLGGEFRPITANQKKQMSISYGIQVTKTENGAFKKAGISRGFIIQKVNDVEMKTIDDLQKAVKSASTSSDPVLYIQGIWPTGKKAYFAVPLDKD